MKIKKPKKSSRKALVKKCDELASAYVRLRDKRRYGGFCPLCYKNDIQCAFHFMRRGMYSTRWDVDWNLLGTCASCNYRQEHFPEYATVWYLKKYGQAQYDDLFRRAHKIAKLSREDLKAIREDLEKRLEKVCLE